MLSRDASLWCFELWQPSDNLALFSMHTGPCPTHGVGGGVEGSDGGGGRL